MACKIGVWRCDFNADGATCPVDECRSTNTVETGPDHGVLCAACGYTWQEDCR